MRLIYLKKLAGINKNCNPLSKPEEIFTKTQLVNKEKLKFHWTADDISNAFSITYLSKCCYFLLGKNSNNLLININ